MALQLCDRLPQAINPSKTVRKISELFDGYSTKYLTSPPQNCQGHQQQGKSEKLSAPRGV